MVHFKIINGNYYAYQGKRYLQGLGKVEETTPEKMNYIRRKWMKQLRES